MAPLVPLMATPMDSAKAICGEVKPISSGALNLAVTHFASINHTNTFRMVEATDFYLRLSTVPFSSLALGTLAAQMTLRSLPLRHAFYQSV